MYEQDYCPEKKSKSKARALCTRIIEQGIIIRPDVDETYKKRVNRARAQAACILGAPFKSLQFDPTYDKALYQAGMHFYGTAQSSKSRDTSDWIEQARKYFLEAAQQGHPQSHCMLGNMARDEKSYGKAFGHYLRANLGGEVAEAQFNLGKLYEAGLGIDKDFVAALKWYQKLQDNSIFRHWSF